MYSMQGSILVVALLYILCIKMNIYNLLNVSSENNTHFTKLVHVKFTRGAVGLVGHL